ncbi:hypothetical protein NO976_01455 [Planktothrix agardhii]|jgi:hypothetical protein|uniref:Uncharacterized protein n=2 Tax=Planktothrix TaxID=54304 RepID=A0A6J7ZHY2_PLARU|nr:hypothetical protein PLAN_150066 [Planktothrix rubescens NIVA-CYA 18]CAD5923020.1 hypothetical protein PCC7805_00793 [Planktothrix agardhii]CAD5939135.1 hypothetical protein NO108_02180 [Planktothrix rubescens]BBD55396.1 hypothetical protein NIES204_27030 [Planktothrix agardhii NIES-204]CAD5927644.1 hypothetical protein PCC7821_01068 [Planktothrix rubescens NIVA-CYA 18]
MIMGFLSPAFFPWGKMVIRYMERFVTEKKNICQIDVFKYILFLITPKSLIG